VVDVQAGILLPARHDEIDEILERLLFGGACEGPFMPVCWLTLFIAKHVADIQQPAFHFSEVGGVVREPVLLRLKVRPRRDDIHMLRRKTLHFAKQIGMHAKLEHRSRPCFAGQLCIDRLVRPIAQRARRLHAAQNVGAANPALVRKRTLNDDGDALLHSGQCFGDRFVCDFDTVDSDDLQTRLRQMIDIVFFVNRSTLPQNSQKRVPGFRLRQSAFDDGAVEI
jgi:hypothetical protein